MPLTYFTPQYAYQDGGTLSGTTSLEIDGNNGSTKMQVADDAQITLTFTGFTPGVETLLEVTNGAASGAAISWPAGTLFSGGAYPDLQVAGRDNIIVYMDQDGKMNVALAEAALAVVE